MAERRLPLWWLITATAVALVAAAVVVLVLGGGDSKNTADDGTSGGYEVTPQGEVPTSTHEIVLGSLDDGPSQSLHTLMTGKPMVLNFFASWCQPCLEEMPAFETVHQDLGEQVTFVGLAEKDEVDKAKSTVDQTGVTYPTFTDKTGGALTFFESINMPTTVFLDAAGEVVDMKSGEMTEDELRGKIRELFAVG